MSVTVEIPSNVENTSMSESDRIAIEQAAKAEGTADAMQDAAITDASIAAGQAQGIAQIANDRIDGIYSMLDSMNNRLNSMEAQMQALAAVTVETAAIVEEATVSEIETTENTETEIKPVPATEPKKRRRTWA